MIVAPKAKPNDGVADLVLIKPFPFYLYPVFVARMFLGLLKESRYVGFVKTKIPITIKSTFNKFHMDGEPVKRTNPVEVSMERGKIKIIKTAHNKQDSR